MNLLHRPWFNIFARQIYQRLPLAPAKKFRLKRKYLYLQGPGLIKRLTKKKEFTLPNTDPLKAMVSSAKQYRAKEPWILVVDLFAPRPDQDSGSVRMTAILSLLRAMGIRITFIANSNDKLRPYEKRLTRQGISVFRGFTAATSHLAKEGGKYHFVLLSRPEETFQYLPLVRAFALKAKVFYDTVDLHWIRFEREMEISGSPSLVQKIDFYRRMELFNVTCSDVTLAITPEEKACILKERPDAQVEILPNIHEAKPLQTPFDQRKGLMFIGGFWHKPNEDAVFYFVREILPVVVQHIPDVVFYVIGSKMPAAIKALRSKHVQPLGFVPNVEPYFGSCRVFVAPLRYGAGMKGKIGHSIALGLPVVTTPVGAEGMALVNKTHVLIAQQPEEFARSIVQLYSDEALWHRLSSNALSHIDTNFSVEATRRRMGRIFAHRS